MPRKGENIYKRKDGRWEGRYILDYTEFGKAKYKYLYAGTYSEIKKKLILAQSGMAASDAKSTSQSKEKYDYWLDAWLKSKKSVVKESTFVRYRNIIKNHIKPQLGEYQISRINTEIMERYISHALTQGRLDEKGGLSAKSMTDILVIIKETFKFAQKNNAAVHCNFQRVTIRRNLREMRVLSRSEEQRLLQLLFDNTDRYKLGVLLCLYTGIRIGELCALQWDSISFADRTLRVKHTMQRLQTADNDSECKTHIRITEPKSFSAIRTIPLPDFLLQKMKLFAESPSAYLLSGDRNQYIEPRTMQYKFKRFLSDANICDANFHSLRHTFATRCIEVGFDVKTLSEILGHSSVKITLDKYVHSSMEQKRNNMEKLQCIVGDLSA